MSCCAIGCKNRHGQSKEIHFHRIPSTRTPFEEERRALWLQAINRTDWNEDTIANARICSAHFISGKDFIGGGMFPVYLRNLVIVKKKKIIIRPRSYFHYELISILNGIQQVTHWAALAVSL